MPQSTYTLDELITALNAVGLESGDIVFSHTGLGFLGRPEPGHSMDAACRMLDQAFNEVLGVTGTLVIPTYTYSFCKQQTYDPDLSPAEVGDFPNYFRRLPGVRRSMDPIFSVAARGPATADLIDELPRDCFGQGSVYDRLVKANAKLCNLGVGFRYATFIHYVEQLLGVPYRFKKLFCGTALREEGPRKEGWVYNVRVLGPNGWADLSALEEEALKHGVLKIAPLGRSSVTCISIRDLFELSRECVIRNPWFLAKGPAADIVALEEQRVPRRQFSVSLPPAANMAAIVEALWSLPRDIVSDGFDAALNALAEQVPLTIHTYPTGLECWTWIVPEKWSCLQGYLEKTDGQRIFSYEDNPLHVMSYSLPINRIVPRDELLEHLHTHPVIKDAIPFRYGYYDRDWGLCCSAQVKESLSDPEYRVVIESEFSYGQLKVGEILVPGESEECFVFCAHLDHPFQVNDGLIGVALGLELMRRLKSRHLRYSYRMLIVSETIGSLAFLSQNEALIPKIIGGLYFEMLGFDAPHRLHLSHRGDTEVDRIFSRAARAFDPHVEIRDFEPMNDERQFNAPGVRVPMLALYRYPDSPQWPYPEYHSHLDSPALVNWNAVEHSLELVLAMVESLETAVIPINRFKGEFFFSRYGLPKEGYNNKEARDAFYRLMFMIDGIKSVGTIAEELDLPPATVNAMLAELRDLDLITFK